jgi:TonB family protein
VDFSAVQSELQERQRVALAETQIEGKYEILDKISEGGMGAVYKVRHRFLDEIRVVKVIRANLEPNPELSRRFLREAQLANKLRHPNIAALHDFAVGEDGNAFIVMEFIAGVTLERLLRAAGPPPVGLTLEIARQALAAMGFLHAHGFVHRDIAPDNLMLARGAGGGPQVKLIDLGIAKVLAGESAFTSTGIFLGKPRYASPEHFGTTEIDGRSDLYSFGVVLYELLTGQCPVVGRDPASYMAGHLFRAPLGFAETDPAGRVPRELRLLVLRILAKRPEERFASAEELGTRIAALQSRFPPRAADLDAALALGAAGPPAGEPPPAAGSSQQLLNREFGPGTTPPPAARALPAGSIAGGGDRARARPPGGELDLLLGPGRGLPRPDAGQRGSPLDLDLPVSTAPPRSLDLVIGNSGARPGLGAGGNAGSAVARRGGMVKLWVVGLAVLAVAGVLAAAAWVLLRPATRRPGADLAAPSGSRAAPARSIAPPPVVQAPPANAASTAAAGTAEGIGIASAPEVPPKAAAQASGTPAPETPAAGGKGAGRRRQPPAAAPQAEAAPVEQVPGLLVPGPGFEAPEPLEIADAVYPEVARGTGRQPHVLVAVLIDEHGNVAAAHVKSGGSSRLGFEEAALDAARRSRFLPARKDGVRGKAWGELIIEFISPPVR